MKILVLFGGLRDRDSCYDEMIFSLIPLHVSFS